MRKWKRREERSLSEGKKVSKKKIENDVWMMNEAMQMCMFLFLKTEIIFFSSDLISFGWEWGRKKIDRFMNCCATQCHSNINASIPLGVSEKISLFSPVESSSSGKSMFNFFLLSIFHINFFFLFSSWWIGILKSHSIWKRVILWHFTRSLV